MRTGIICGIRVWLNQLKDLSLWFKLSAQLYPVFKIKTDNKIFGG
jgi:hypothetical protein